MELIHAQARENGGQKRLERANGFRRRGPIAQVGLLHHILSIHRTPEHAVGDGKEVGPVGFKGFHRYFLSNTNTGWVTAARSNSSSEESAVTP